MNYLYDIYSHMFLFPDVFIHTVCNMEMREVVLAEFRAASYKKKKKKNQCLKIFSAGLVLHTMSCEIVK